MHRMAFAEHSKTHNYYIVFDESRNHTHVVGQARELKLFVHSLLCHFNQKKDTHIHYSHCSPVWNLCRHRRSVGAATY